MITSVEDWFRDSIAVDESKNPQLFYHGSVDYFTSFDLRRIRANETDAYYNGFWFTSDDGSASPAWRNPNFLMTVYLRLCNPAPHTAVRKVAKEVSDCTDFSRYANCRSYADAVRFELQALGYDGVIHADKPVVNKKEFFKTGRTSYKTVRGSKYTLERDKEYNGVNLLDHRGECITGYTNIDEFMTLNSERIFVVFDPSQILIVTIEPIKW